MTRPSHRAWLLLTLATIPACVSVALPDPARTASSPYSRERAFDDLLARDLIRKDGSISSSAALEQIARKTGALLVIPGCAEDRDLRLPALKPRFRDALDALAALMGAEWRREGDAYVLQMDPVDLDIIERLRRGRDLGADLRRLVDSLTAGQRARLQQGARLRPRDLSFPQQAMMQRIAVGGYYAWSRVCDPTALKGQGVALAFRKTPEGGEVEFLLTTRAESTYAGRVFEVESVPLHLKADQGFEKDPTGGVHLNPSRDLRITQEIGVPTGTWWADGESPCIQQALVERLVSGKWVPQPNVRVTLSVTGLQPGSEVWSDPNRDQTAYTQVTDHRGVARRTWYATNHEGSGPSVFNADFARSGRQALPLSVLRHHRHE